MIEKTIYQNEEEKHKEAFIKKSILDEVGENIGSFMTPLMLTDNEVLKYLDGQKSKETGQELLLIGDLVMAGSQGLIDDFEISPEHIGTVNEHVKGYSLSLQYRHNIEKFYDRDIDQRIEEAKIFAQLQENEPEKFRKIIDRQKEHNKSFDRSPTKLKL